jgi:hypothetical protein
VACPPFLADPGLIHEPEHDLLARMGLGCGRDSVAKPLLAKSSAARASRFGWTGLLPRQAEPAHDPRHGLRTHRLAEPLLNEAAEVRQRPARRLPSLRVRADQDPVDQHRLLAQDLPPVTVRAVHQAGEPLGVEPDHRVAQRLPLDPSRPRRIRSPHPLQRVGDCQHPLRRSAARLLLGQAPQLGWRRHIFPDRQPAFHRDPPAEAGRH